MIIVPISMRGKRFQRFATSFYSLHRKVGNLLFPKYRIFACRYIYGLCRHCRVGDTDMAGLIEPNNDIVDFREKAAESVKDVAFIIGSIDLLKKVCSFRQSDLVGWKNGN